MKKLWNTLGTTNGNKWEGNETRKELIKETIQWKQLGMKWVAARKELQEEKNRKKPGIGMERNRGRKILKLDETGSVIEGTGKELGKN